MTRSPDSSSHSTSAPEPGDTDASIPLKLEDFLPYRLNQVSEVVSRSFSRMYAERYGMARPEWRVIAIIGQFGRVTAKTVGERSTMHKTKVSRAVSALEKRGFVKRTANPEDMREAFLELTEEGKTAYDTLVPKALTFSTHLMHSLSEDERYQLDEILHKLTDAARTFKS